MLPSVLSVNHMPFQQDGEVASNDDNFKSGYAELSLPIRSSDLLKLVP